MLSFWFTSDSIDRIVLTSQATKSLLRIDSVALSYAPSMGEI